MLARADQAELWLRAEACRQARHDVLEVALGLPGAAAPLLSEIDAAHSVVEAAERVAASAGLARARPARQALARAYSAEKAVLNRAGFESWSHFALRRIDVLAVPAAHAALRQAEEKLARAEASWKVMAGDIDVDVAFAAREAIETHALPPEAESSAPGMAPVPVAPVGVGVQVPVLSEVATA